MEGSTVMQSENIGLIFNEETKELVMVVDTENDMYLYDPSYLKGAPGEKRKRVIVPRKVCPLFELGKMSKSGVAYIQENSEKFFNEDF